MEFLVCSRSKAKKLSYKLDKPTIIISITDPVKPLNTFANNANIVSILRLQFDDTDPDILWKNEILMSKKDAENIKHFVETFKERAECILVHCEAGISRSSGVLAAIKKYMTGNDEDIFNNKKYCPNVYCYRLTLNALLDVPEGSAFGTIED